jgi:hypothetical protein
MMVAYQPTFICFQIFKRDLPDFVSMQEDH